jgi:hypothetical protein
MTACKNIANSSFPLDMQGQLKFIAIYSWKERASYDWQQDIALICNPQEECMGAP